MDSISLTDQGILTWSRFSIAAEPQLLMSLPTAFGVYVILLAGSAQRRRGSSDIGYIGRAANQNGIRGRVRQYFHPGSTQSTNIAMRQRLSASDCALRLRFVTTVNVAAAKRLESDLLIQFETEHGELPPFNRQRSLDLMSRVAEGAG